MIFYEPDQLPDFLPFDGGIIFPVGFQHPFAANGTNVLNDHTYCCEVSGSMCADGREPTVEEGKTVCKSFHDRKVAQRVKDARRLNSGLVFTEFGACKNTPGCVEEIRGATDAFDKNFLSWMYW